MNDFTPEEARTHTDRLRYLIEDAGKIPDLIIEAYKRRAWVALDYVSWSAYVSEEFGSIRLVHSAEERRALAEHLDMAGLTVRAIAPVVGASKTTVADDLSTVRNRTVEGPASALTLSSEPEDFDGSCGKTGLDGRTRATLTVGENLTRRADRLASDILSHWGELDASERDELFWKFSEIVSLMSSVIEPPVDAREAFPGDVAEAERVLSAV